jgi:alpha-tubulin suppressor-like RCC1 family protein
MPNYSGMWTLQAQMQAKAAGLWTGIPQFTLWSWGQNKKGQLGQNDTIYRSSPVQVGALTTWLNVDACIYNTAATKSDGTLWTWGSNSYGMLGQNDTIYRSSPVQVGALTTWSKVALGFTFTVSTKTDGTLWTWGANYYGTLGQNIAYTINRSSPVQVGSLTTWSNIASGGNSTFATKTDGTLWSWGYNYKGQLGQNIATTINRSSPVQVGALTTWLNVACGGYHIAATKTDGTLWSWGNNGFGQLGQNGTIDRSSPVQVGALTTWLNVACGAYHTAATKTDGTLWIWGQNSFGQLGLNDASVNRSSPVQVGALTTWSKVSCGKYSTVATKSDGTLWAWGDNSSGQLGENNVNGYSSPVQVGTLNTWINVACGDNHVITVLNIPT